ncbi:MAG: hypothetical protein ABIZ70_12080 [Gemmatimonadales bacterium]
MLVVRMLAIVYLLSAASLPAQATALGRPTGRLAEEFSDIRGARELKDGRLIVSDYIDQRVVLVDFEKGTVTSRIGKGGGPAEVRLPTRLTPLAGDSTMVADIGNNRLLIVDGEGRGARTIPVTQEGLLGARGVDRSGAFYFAIPGWAERDKELPNDSVRIVRWNPRTGAMTNVAVVQGERMRSDIRSPALTPRIPTVGYAAQDNWVVSDAGVLRIVRGGNYQVESRAPGAAPVIGPSYAYPTRPVTASERAAYVHEFIAGSPTSGKGANGGMGQTPMPSDAELAQITRGTEFASHHPMFEPGAVKVTPGGQLWVGRRAGSGNTMQYDIFDAAGRRTATVVLPPDRRVILIGRQSVYLIADDDDIQRLERYPLPK